MNRINLLLMTTIAAAGMLFAQGPGGLRLRGLERGGQGGRLAARANMQQRREGRLLASYLGLTADQIAKQKEINQAAAAQAKPIRQELNQTRKQLQEAIRTLQPVDTLAAQVGNLTGQLEGIQAKARQDFLRILTPDQLQKLQQLSVTPSPAPSVKQ
jgi:Spy/CpxP family protein refolding chaperone